MLNQKITELLNRQFNMELYSAYLYFSYRAFFDRSGLDGYASWYDVQAKEELDHAQMIYRYLTEQGEEARFDAIAAIPAADGILDTLRAAKAHEEKITGMIHRIYSEAHDAEDWRTVNFLTWFVKEQEEEERNAEEMIRKFLLYGACDSCQDCGSICTGTDFGICGSGLYSINKELACRKYCPCCDC